MNSEVSKRVAALAIKDLTEGRFLTPDQCKTVKVLMPSMLFLTAKKLPFVCVCKLKCL